MLLWSQSRPLGTFSRSASFAPLTHGGRQYVSPQREHGIEVIQICMLYPEEAYLAAQLTHSSMPSNDSSTHNARPSTPNVYRVEADVHGLCDHSTMKMIQSEPQRSTWLDMQHHENVPPLDTPRSLEPQRLPSVVGQHRMFAWCIFQPLGIQPISFLRRPFAAAGSTVGRLTFRLRMLACIRCAALGSLHCCTHCSW